MTYALELYQAIEQYLQDMLKEEKVSKGTIEIQNLQSQPGTGVPARTSRTARTERFTRVLAIKY